MDQNDSGARADRFAGYGRQPFTPRHADWHASRMTCPRTPFFLLQKGVGLGGPLPSGPILRKDGRQPNRVVNEDGYTENC